MKVSGLHNIFALVLLAMNISVALAATDHATLVKGPFKSGEDVTKVCLKCHEKQAADFMKTSHWSWTGTPNHLKGMEKSSEKYGKANMVNAVCTSIEGGRDGVVHEQCSKCHAGYGWTRTKFDFTDKMKIDCLVCHAKKGNYARAVGGTVDMKAVEKGSLNLELAAQSVGAPGRGNCGYCHYFGGGEDSVKVPGIESTLEKKDRKLDVHMGTKKSGGEDMTCQACHTATDHKIAGASSMTAHYDSRVNCEDCHIGAKAPHQKSKNGAIIALHSKRVACQTCHIPYYGRSQATKMEWYWSDAGKDLKSEEQFDKETYVKKMGRFRWGMNEKPVYAWYNGKMERYMKGDKVTDPTKPVVMNKPDGTINDKNAKIYPYKLFISDLPMDSKYRYLNIFQHYKSFWVDFNWEKALKGGAEGSGLPYSGSYQFVKVASYFALSHEVAPQEDALQCGECHAGNGRMDWQALGYKGDPMGSSTRPAKVVKKQAKQGLK